MSTTLLLLIRESHSSFFFFFNDTATTEIYTLSLHDALPISRVMDGELEHRVAVPQEHQGFVDGDTGQPCGESGFPFELLQVNEGFLEGLLDNVFSIFPNACVAERNPKNLSLLALDQDFKRRFISTLGGSDELFLRNVITGRTNGNGWFVSFVRRSTQHGASPLDERAKTLYLPFALARTKGKTQAKPPRTKGIAFSWEHLL